MTGFRCGRCGEMMVLTDPSHRAAPGQRALCETHTEIVGYVAEGAARHAATGCTCGNCWQCRCAAALAAEQTPPSVTETERSPGGPQRQASDSLATQSTPGRNECTG